MLFLFVGAMFVSLFYMSTDMGAMENMSDCPFMSHEEVFCPMTLIDHIGAWKSVFLAVVPAFVLLTLVVVAVARVVAVLPLFLTWRHKPIPIILYARLRERTYSYGKRPLQELFATGILHPKLF